MIVRLSMQAQDGERFAPDVFASTVGTVVSMRIGGDLLVPCTVRDVAVRDEGRVVYLSVEVAASHIGGVLAGVLTGALQATSNGSVR